MPAESSATSSGAVKEALVAGPPIADTSAWFTARHGHDNTCGRYAADASISGIGDVEVPGGIHGDAPGTPERSGECTSAISGKPRATIARHGDDGANRSNFSDTVVGRLRDIEVPCGVEFDCGGYCTDAWAPGPPSPENDGTPLPATVMMVPLEETLGLALMRTDPAATYNSPDGEMATDGNEPRAMSLTGVPSSGPPPAKVWIVYWVLAEMERKPPLTRARYRVAAWQ
ncbi:MAG: hypothetical protein U0R19_11130 [Bryobacteraceae bacterium]